MTDLQTALALAIEAATRAGDEILSLSRERAFAVQEKPLAGLVTTAIVHAAGRV